MRRSSRWCAPLLVLVVAAAVRFWALGRPELLVFDESYYVRDAISQLTHGAPTIWPEGDTGTGDLSNGFSGDPSNAVHPPLGKWLIGIGILLFGAESSFGWRCAVALSGVATVALTMRLGWRMSRNLWIACLAGLLLAVDGVHVVLSRVALLDGVLASFIVLGALFVWRDQEHVSASVSRAVRGELGCGTTSNSTRWAELPLLWRRPWLVAAAAVFGAATAVKWSGAYALAGLLVFITVRDLVLRARIARLHQPAEAHRTGLLARTVLRSGSQALLTAVLTLPLAAASYLASWIGWIANPGAWHRSAGEPWPVSLWAYHRDMLVWHASLNAEHPFQAHPLGWPLGLVPTAMHRTAVDCPWAGDCVSVISPLPNLLITWGGVAALIALSVLLILRACSRRRLPGSGFALAAAFTVAGYLSGWLPWVLTFSRSAVFQFYTVVLTPFAALALALVIGVLCASARAPAPLVLDQSPESLRGRRIAATLFVATSLLVSAFFLPLWTAEPVPEWFWRLHLWLPRWV